MLDVDCPVRLLLCGFLLCWISASGNAVAQPDPLQDPAWFTLDKVGDADAYLLRQADIRSLTYDAPWATFRQRWIPVAEGKPKTDQTILELQAINCLTGAFGGLEYPGTDPVTEQRIIVINTPDEIERSSGHKLNVIAPEAGLQSNVFKFACTCKKTGSARKVDDQTIADVYQTFVQTQTAVRFYHLRFMEFDSKEAAEQALQQLNAGQKFAEVAERLQPRASFPGGDLGEHAENEWTPRWLRVFRELKPGGYTTQPIKDYSTYSLYYLEGFRDEPALSVEKWKPTIDAFLQREAACGK